MNLQKIKRILVLMLACTVVAGSAVSVYADNDGEGGQEVTEEITEENTEDSAEEITEENAEGSAEEITEENAEDSAGEITEENVEDSAEEITEENTESEEQTEETAGSEEQAEEQTEETAGSEEQAEEQTEETAGSEEQAEEQTEETTGSEEQTEETAGSEEQAEEQTEETAGSEEQAEEQTEETTGSEEQSEGNTESSEQTEETADTTDTETTDSGTTAEVSGSIESADIELSATTFTYDGTEQCPAATVTLDGVVLTEGTHYTVTYNNNINVGIAAMTITGIGDCTGTVTRSFTITAAALKKATLDTTVYIWDGTAKKPGVTVTNAAGEVLTKGTDYSLTYTRKKRIGKATVTITGKGNYAGSILTKTYKIKPDQVTIRGAESLAVKRATIKWKKAGGNAKYEIAYKVRGTSTFSYKTVSKTKVKAVLTGLQSGKVYKVKVRAIKTVDGVTYRGAWSNALFVTIR